MSRVEVSVSGIEIKIIPCTGMGCGLHRPSEKGVQEFTDWLYTNDFGDWEQESLEELSCGVLLIGFVNKSGNYGRIDDIVKIVKEKAEKVLRE